MEFARRRRTGLIAGGLAILVAAIGPLRADRQDRRAGETVVEVLNGTGRNGLARQVTRLLREEGIDVVYFGSVAERPESTVVLIRRGEPSRGHRVARLLGTRAVTSRPDPKRHVDVTVILGADYRLPRGRFPL